MYSYYPRNISLYFFELLSLILVYLTATVSLLCEYSAYIKPQGTLFKATCLI